VLTHSLKKQYDQILNLIDRTDESCGSNLELYGHWGKYICILAAGFLENAIGEVYQELVSKSSSPFVSNYTLRSLEKLQNPKASRFVEVASSFKREWGSDLEAFLNANSNVREAIDSIMNNRHLIAHGKNTSISVVKMKEYLASAVKLIEFIEGQCGYS
jgi:hypothetical protein